MVRIWQYARANATLCASVLLLVAIVGGIAYQRSDRVQIRRRFNRLAVLAGRGPSDSMIAMAARSEQLSSLFADRTTLAVPITGLTGEYSRREIVQSAIRVKSLAESIQLDFHDLRIRDISGDNAYCTVTGRLRAVISGERINEVRELDCHLVREDGRWVFKSFSVAEVLQR